MTPDGAGGCAPAIAAGKPMTINQALTSPATTDWQLFPDIIPNPSAIDNPAL
jgi:hypothetical protein